MEAIELIKNLEPKIIAINNKNSEAAWAYYSNLTEENESRMKEVSVEAANISKDIAKQVNNYDWKKFKNEDLKRQMFFLSKQGYAVLPEDKYKELIDVLSEMEGNFAKVKVCDYKNKTKCDLYLEPELENIIATSRDPDELKYYWLEFYNAFSNFRDNFQKYIELITESAKLNSKHN